MRKPLASVIVLNWNGSAYLERCLDSLKKQTYENFEIILVDNGSTDGSLDIISQRYHDTVKLIKNEYNLGFAEGNNIGIGFAQGKYIITLNNDTESDPDWITQLVSAAEENDSIGMCASRILLFENPGVIDSVGVKIYFDGTSKQRGHLETDRGQYSHSEEVLLPSACAALYRKQMLEEVGVFDKDFFFYCEDTDLGLRGRFAGWKAVYVPKAKVRHLYSGTGGRFSPLKAYHVERNHFWIALKFFPLPLLLALPLFTLLRIFVQTLSVLLLSDRKSSPTEKVRKPQIFIAVLKAYGSLGRSLPTVFRKRKAIWGKKKTKDPEIYGWFKRFGLKMEDLVLVNNFDGGAGSPGKKNACM